MNSNKMLYSDVSEKFISYGIICFNISKSLNITNKNIENYFYNKFHDISEYNYSNLNNIKLIPKFYDNIKILMIKRKYSLNYIEFIRGKYNGTEYNKLFTLMSKDEIIKIKSNTFELLWNDLWKETSQNKIYQKEYNLSKIKFTQLQNVINELDTNITEYTDPEWGFPKGKKNSYEKNINCAIREFNEETNIIIDNNIHILERVNCIEDSFIGTNMKNYKSIYYLAHSNIENQLDDMNYLQINEVGDIHWFTIPEALAVMRPYNNSMIKIIHQIYFFIINLIVDIRKQQIDYTVL